MELVYYFLFSWYKGIILRHSNERMKYVIVSMFALLVWVPKIVRAQVIVKTGYISSSSYKGENGRQTGGKGDLKFVEGSVNIPVSQKLNERK